MLSLRAASRNKRELFKVRGFLRNLNAGNLAEELAGRIRCAVRRIKNGVGGIARAEFQTIIALEPLPLNAFAVDKRTVLAPLIDEEESIFFEHDEGVVAGNTRIGNHQVLIHLAPHAERSAVKDDVSLLVALHEHQRGKYA